MKVIKIQNNNSGFTLIELLIVIAICALLASILLVAVTHSRLRSQVTKALADLQQVRKTIEDLHSDTGKYPGGCPIGGTGNARISLDQRDGGLLRAPRVRTVSGNCIWTAEEVAKWQGPYLSSPNLQFKDPWGTSYTFDQRYTISTIRYNALVSWGPDARTNTYNSDNIFILLK